ncbi:uncharacterized protein LOC109716088 [Ananas comosus]|uniref:Uncharacterized protein LOC109716088 n=1 Tax=Ananas comosus TaxID=4615 RepID=A0A6P5FM50_ANACO|nr:uncharacterized protein LOC109716088 [Ananas comosus]
MTLLSSFPGIHVMTDCKLLTVKDCFGSDDWNWNRILVGVSDVANINTGPGSNLFALRERVGNYRVVQSPDTIGWRWSNNGVFSVKSVYRALSDGGTRDGHASKIWKLQIPLKVKVFCWLVLKKKPLTADNLVKKG